MLITLTLTGAILMVSAVSLFLWRTEVTIAIELGIVVDAVITWVNGSDPEWQSRFFEAARSLGVAVSEERFEARYISCDELRACVRSLMANTPWINRVFIITDRQRPFWLNETDPRVHVVDHAALLSEPAFLADTIQFNIWRIEELSEFFIVLDDDFLIWRPCAPSFFFTGHTPRMHVHGWPKRLRGNASRACNATFPFWNMVINAHDLVERRHGPLAWMQSAHVALPVRKSVLRDVYQKYELWTIESAFRSCASVQFPALMIFDGLATGRGVAVEGEGLALIERWRPDAQRRGGIGDPDAWPPLICVNKATPEAVAFFLERWPPVSFETI